MTYAIEILELVYVFIYDIRVLLSTMLVRLCKSDQ